MRSVVADVFFTTSSGFRLVSAIGTHFHTFYTILIIFKLKNDSSGSNDPKRIMNCKVHRRCWIDSITRKRATKVVFPIQNSNKSDEKPFSSFKLQLINSFLVVYSSIAIFGPKHSKSMDHFFWRNALTLNSRVFWARGFISIRFCFCIAVVIAVRSLLFSFLSLHLPFIHYPTILSRCYSTRDLHPFNGWSLNPLAEL